MLLIGSLYNAVIFGNLALIIQEFSKKTARFQEKIDTANTAMNNMELPDSLKSRVINYMRYTSRNLDRETELIQFNKLVSPSLMLEVRSSIFLGVIMENKIFSNTN
jgi:hypothetical protein